MVNMHKFKEDFILLCEAGFIAVNQADEDSANKLFRASQLLSPENTLAAVGKGYLHLCKLELKQACKIFEDILHTDPHNEMAKAFLGLSYSLNPNEVNKGEKILHESASHAKDPLIKSLSENAIDFVEKFVKKAPTPAQVHPGHEKKKK